MIRQDVINEWSGTLSSTLYIGYDFMIRGLIQRFGKEFLLADL